MWDSHLDASSLLAQRLAVDYSKLLYLRDQLEQGSDRSADNEHRMQILLAAYAAEEQARARGLSEQQQEEALRQMRRDSNDPGPFPQAIYETRCTAFAIPVAETTKQREAEAVVHYSDEIEHLRRQQRQGVRIARGALEQARDDLNTSMSRFSTAVQMLAARMSDNMVEHATHMYSQHNYPDDPGRAALAETLNRIHRHELSDRLAELRRTMRQEELDSGRAVEDLYAQIGHLRGPHEQAHELVLRIAAAVGRYRKAVTEVAVDDMPPHRVSLALAELRSRPQARLSPLERVRLEVYEALVDDPQAHDEQTRMHSLGVRRAYAPTPRRATAVSY